MASYTSNYQLHQWVPEDDFLRTDFNEDFQKIDTAIKGVKNQVDGLAASKPDIVTGTYIGDGAATRTINLGFYPKAVLLEFFQGGREILGDYYGGLALRGKPTYRANPDTPILKVVSNGFQVAENGTVSAAANSNTQEYYYLAVK